MLLVERFLVFSCLVCAIGCTKVDNGTVANEKIRESLRKSRGLTSYAGLITCAVKYDAGCFIDAAQEYLDGERTELLAEADAEAYRATGRSDPESKPSHLANVISKLISELGKMFEGGLSGFFKSARDSDGDDDENVSEGDGNGTARAGGEYAKKRHRKKGLLKSSLEMKKRDTPPKKVQEFMNMLTSMMILYGIKEKLGLLLKFVGTAISAKMLMVSVAELVLKKLQFLVQLKMLKEPKQKVIYQQESYHDHRYVDDRHGSGWLRR